MLRYVEANPLRARMVERAEAWRWSSLGGGGAADGTRVELEPWAVDRPAAAEWLAIVNEPLAEPEVDRLRVCVKRGRPYGRQAWVERIARRLGLESSMRDPWRPKKHRTKGSSDG